MQAKGQRGFTLIEMAIVLVIIGLILGAVLKGQELIDNSKAKKAMNDINSIIAAYYGYIDRYNRIPGDDGPVGNLTARGSAWSGMAAGDNNGILAATAAQTFTGAGENDEFFRHLRAAGFLTGSPADAGAASCPRNSFGGLIGVMNDAVLGYSNATQNICLGHIPGKGAANIDNQMDDGRPNQGTVRATVGPNNVVPGTAPTTYSEDIRYTLCVAF